MPENVTKKHGGSYVVKVTGMSEAMLALLDARVERQQATGRAEYIRELIRRDALTGSGAAPGRGAKRRKAHSPRAAAEAALERQRLIEYHALVDQELGDRLSPGEQARLHELEEALDLAEAKSPEASAMLAQLEETAGKLDALLAAVRALPQAPA